MIDSLDLREVVADQQTVIDPPYDVRIQPEVVAGQMVFVASHPDLPGCMSDGSTPEEALANLAEARELYLEALHGSGLPIPPKTLHPVVSVVIPGRDLRHVIDPELNQTPWQMVVSERLR
jgi:antitoxin HicB